MNQDTSVTGRAYDILRRELVSCQLAPGARLNIALLQSRLSLSQAAVREALSRLTAEGLVEIERNRGFRAAPVSITGFRELTEACLTVELPCLRSSVRNGGVDWELGVVSVYNRAARTLQLVVEGRQSIADYSQERLHFYEALLSACDNKWLLWSWRMLYTQNLRYRHLYGPLAKFELSLNDHHEAIIQAVFARDVDKVEALSIQNYEKVIRFMESDAVVKEMSARAGAPIADEDVA